MTEPRPNKVRDVFLTCLVIGASVWLADFRFTWMGEDSTNVPILADDWAIEADLLWDRARSSDTKIREILTESWEARPLRAIELLLIRVSYGLFGLRGPMLLQWFILTLSGTLFALLCRSKMPRVAAILAGALVVLHPADTTHIWLATMMAKLGCLYALIAILCFRKERLWFSGLFLLASAMSYELSPLIFVLALPFAKSLDPKTLLRFAAVTLSAGLFYLGWRFFVFVEVAPDVRVTTGGESGFDFSSYLAGFVTAFRSLFWETTFGSPLFSCTQLLVPALVGLLITFGVIRFCKRESFNTPTAKVACSLLAFGIVATANGAILSFRAAPTSDLGIASRHNIASTYGATLALVAFLFLVSRLGGKRWTHAVFIFLATATCMVFGQIRNDIQNERVEAGAYQRQEMSKCVDALGALPPHTLVVLKKPLHAWEAKHAIAAPFITGHSYEIDAILKLVYDKSVVGFCLQEPNDHERGKTSPASVIAKEQVQFHSIVEYDCISGNVTWLKKSPLDNGEELIKPRGPAWDYLRGK